MTTVQAYLLMTRMEERDYIPGYDDRDDEFEEEPEFDDPDYSEDTRGTFGGPEKYGYRPEEM